LKVVVELNNQLFYGSDGVSVSNENCKAAHGIPGKGIDLEYRQKVHEDLVVKELALFVESNGYLPYT
jgi:hypothetical protein